MNAPAGNDCTTAMPAPNAVAAASHQKPRPVSTQRSPLQPIRAPQSTAAAWGLAMVP